MAFSTHAVPILALPGPVEPVLMIICMVWKGIPSLFFIIPGNGQALQSATWKRNQILLQGGKSKDMGNLEIMVFTILPNCIYKKSIFIFKKPCGDIVMDKPGVIKISENSSGVCYIHGLVMVGVLPFFIFIPVALFTVFSAHKIRRFFFTLKGRVINFLPGF